MEEWVGIQWDNCVSDLRDPNAVKWDAAECFGTSQTTYATRETNRVGDLTVPRRLYAGVDASDTARKDPCWDSENNIIVYFETGGKFMVRAPQKCFAPVLLKLLKQE